MNVPRRSLITGGAALATLVGLQERANADTAFTSFAFTATGEPAARTMPDRLAEIKNVKDFGAVGDNSHDDTNNIQNAINWTAGANRGTIYFPIGDYKITAPLTFNAANLNIRFLGEGNGSTLHGGGFSSGGYVLDRSLASPSNTAQVCIEHLTIGLNDSTVTGGIRLGSCNLIMVRECSPVSLTTEDSAGNSSQDFNIKNCIFSEGGLIIGGTGAVQGCNFVNCLVAVRAYGKGFYLGGNRVENCGTGYLLGLDSGSTDQNASGFFIGGSMEGNWLSVDFGGTCSAFCVGPLNIQGHDHTNAGPNPSTGSLTVSSYTYNNGNGATSLTMASAIPSFITTGTLIYPVGLNLTGLNVQQTCTSGTSGTTINFTGSAGLGSASGGGFVNMNQQYGVWVRANKASYGLFNAITTGNVMDVAGLQVDAATNRSALLFLNGTFNQSGGAGVGFVPPSNAYTAQFQGCNVDPIWTFSQLATAGGSNVVEGEQFSISDGTTNTWGANVTAGSGGDRVLVRYNGTNYTVVAK